MDHDAFKAWLYACTTSALEAFRANNARREQPGRDVTAVRLGIGPNGRTLSK